MLNIISNFYIFHVSRYRKRLLRNTGIYLNFIETKQYNFSKTCILTFVQLTSILFSMRVKKNARKNVFRSVSRSNRFPREY